MLPGCRGTSSEHFWELMPGEVHGQVVLIVSHDADVMAVRKAAAKIFDVALGRSTHVVFEVKAVSDADLSAERSFFKRIRAAG